MVNRLEEAEKIVETALIARLTKEPSWVTPAILVAVDGKEYRVMSYPILLRIGAKPAADKPNYWSLER